MRVAFRLWAQLRLSAGTPSIEMDLPDGVTLDRALDLFFAAYQELAPHRSSTRAAIGHEYAACDRILHAGDEISLIPPVQGG
jgi:molybdopterin converting factor small subunit